MAEVQEIRDIRDVPVRARVRRSKPVSLFFTFLLGIICTITVAAAALWLLGVSTTITWPSGRIQLGHNSGSVIVVNHNN